MYDNNGDDNTTRMPPLVKQQQLYSPSNNQQQQRRQQHDTPPSKPRVRRSIALLDPRVLCRDKKEAVTQSLVAASATCEDTTPSPPQRKQSHDNFRRGQNSYSNSGSDHSCNGDDEEDIDFSSSTWTNNGRSVSYSYNNAIWDEQCETSPARRRAMSLTAVDAPPRRILPGYLRSPTRASAQTDCKSTKLSPTKAEELLLSIKGQPVSTTTTPPPSTPSSTVKRQQCSPITANIKLPQSATKAANFFLEVAITTTGAPLSSKRPSSPSHSSSTDASGATLQTVTSHSQSSVAVAARNKYATIYEDATCMSTPFASLEQFDENDFADADDNDQSSSSDCMEEYEVNENKEKENGDNDDEYENLSEIAFLMSKVSSPSSSKNSQYKKFKLRGAKETWESIHVRDFYLSIECSTCQEELCCIRNVGHVWCPACLSLTNTSAKSAHKKDKQQNDTDNADVMSSLETTDSAAVANSPPSRNDNDDDLSTQRQEHSIGLGFTLEDLRIWELQQKKYQYVSRFGSCRENKYSRRQQQILVCRYAKWSVQHGILLRQH